MDFSQTIVRYGADAVQRYRILAEMSRDNEMPEIFFGGYIASAMHDNLNVNGHVERRYTVIAKELGATVDAKVINSIGDYRADLAIYDKQRPLAIVELKIFDDGKSVRPIIADRDKMHKLSELCRVQTYLGVLVTDDVSGALCTDRANALGKALEHEFDSIGDPQNSTDGSWKWLFACGRFS